MNRLVERSAEGVKRERKGYQKLQSPLSIQLSISINPRLPDDLESTPSLFTFLKDLFLCECVSLCMDLQHLNACRAHSEAREGIESYGTDGVTDGCEHHVGAGK